MRSQYPLFQTPIDLAHNYWKQLIKPGQIVVDATCGNGHDTLQLCLYTQGSGKLVAIDIQEKALAQTKERLNDNLDLSLWSHVVFEKRCHSTFPEYLLPQTVQLIVYNLGYLPGGDKMQTTLANHTLKSLEAALLLITPGGAISVTCYPGHEEGFREEEEVLAFARCLDPAHWSVCHHTWLNRHRSPSLLLLQKAHHHFVARNKVIDAV